MSESSRSWPRVLLRSEQSRGEVSVIHSVAPVQNQQGWGNVMYIPAAPWCPRNAEYAPSVGQAFLAGASPTDFPDEGYERDWTNRFPPQALNETGRRGLGFA